MNEQSPQPEKKHGEMVPERLFDESFLRASFVIPQDKDARDESRRETDLCLDCGTYR